MNKNYCFLLSIFYSTLAFSEIDGLDIVAVSAKAPESTIKNKALFFGHNLSQTDDVLNKSEISVGIQVISYGVSDSLTIATSPWLATDYDMVSLFARYKTSPNRSFQFSYFKSCFRSDGCVEKAEWYPDVETGEPAITTTWVNTSAAYSMEAMWLTMIDHYELNDHYSVDINYGVQYYANQKMPFSLKRPAANPLPWQFHVSSLHEASLVGPFKLYAEVGCLLPLDTEPYLHTGASLGYKKNNLESHFGFSITSKIGALFDPAHRVDLQQQIRSERGLYDSDFDADVYKNDYAIHPEFSFQYTF